MSTLRSEEEWFKMEKEMGYDLNGDHEIGDPVENAENLRILKENMKVGGFKTEEYFKQDIDGDKVIGDPAQFSSMKEVGLLKDINNDGVVDSTDYTLSQEKKFGTDLNGDGFKGNPPEIKDDDGLVDGIVDFFTSL